MVFQYPVVGTCRTVKTGFIVIYQTITLLLPPQLRINASFLCEVVLIKFQWFLLINLK